MISNQARGKFIRLLTRLGFTSLTACSVALATGMAIAASASQVPVEQQPLTIQKPLPPNLVLMLDDSGSMSWNYMPDWKYLPNNKTNDALINAKNTGIYYDPTIIYTPPPKADGTRYPSYTDMTHIPFDGFASSPKYVDLLTYDGSYDQHDQSGNTYSGSKIFYNTAGSSASYEYNHSGEKHEGGSIWFGYDTSTKEGCDALFANYHSNEIDHGTRWAYKHSFNDNRRRKTCTIYYFKKAPPYFFQFSTGPKNGPYTVYYVTAPESDGGDCSQAPEPSRCVYADSIGTDTSHVAAPEGIEVGTNIANWFAYYHTRMLMAKSGIMNAFSAIDPKFRIGYGSINRSGSFTHVAPFGDGDSDSQKGKMWKWLTAVNASGNTPLRRALNAVGEYYETDQPWQSENSASGKLEKLSCRASYTILTSDGFWNRDWNGLPQPSNIDGNPGSQIKGPDGHTFTYQPAAPFEDDYSNTLADVAMYYWREDLQPHVDNRVPTSDSDPAFWQHMTTFTMGLGFAPVYGEDEPEIPVDKLFDWSRGGDPVSDFEGWPKPEKGVIENIADLAHAAINGHGAFYSVSTPEDFAAGLKDALRRAGENTGTATGVAASATELQTDTLIYKASYTSGSWRGDLLAYADDLDNHAVNMTPVWSASNQLPAPAERNIYTSAPNRPDLVPFKVTGGTLPPLSQPQKDALGNDTASQIRMINYLRGDNSWEKSKGGEFRNRTYALGDIVNSQPVYVGTPNPDQFDGKHFTGTGETFGQYVTDHQSRNKMVYIAANDGMLHGIEATEGKEVFAYLPGTVITSGLANLADPDYGQFSVPHQYFNDGQITVGDAFTGEKWETVLVGTTGRGLAKTVYALDVSNPKSPELLWVRSAGDSKDNSEYIGQIIGKPIIARTGNDSWSVLIGNGYNSPSGKAALLKFDLFDGDLAAYAAGTESNNGLAAPAVWIDDPSNGISTTAYAGDLKGHVWKFDLSNASGTTGDKVFSATDKEGNTQPITAGMLIANDPDTNNVWLFFGTGRWLGSDDLADENKQSWYGIIVETSPGNSTHKVGSGSGRDDLDDRMILAGNQVNNKDTRSFTDASSLSDGSAGWVIDLDPRERMVTPSQLSGNVLFNTTRIPDAADPCNPAGSGWLLYVNAFTGGRLSNSFVDIDNSGKADEGDSITLKESGEKAVAGGVRLDTMPNLPVIVGGDIFVSQASGNIFQAPIGGGADGANRVSWRELVNP